MISIDREAALEALEEYLTDCRLTGNKIRAAQVVDVVLQGASLGSEVAMDEKPTGDRMIIKIGIGLPIGALTKGESENIILTQRVDFGSDRGRPAVMRAMRAIRETVMQIGIAASEAYQKAAIKAERQYYVSTPMDGSNHNSGYHNPSQSIAGIYGIDATMYESPLDVVKAEMIRSGLEPDVKARIVQGFAEFKEDFMRRGYGDN